MKRKILSALLALCLIVTVMTVNVVAAETFTYKISASTTTPTIGSQIDVVISLSNYAELSGEIRGLQIDVTNIDTSILEVVSHSTLFEDTTAASNITSYQTSKSLVRYVYLHMSGSLDKSVTDVMKFSLKINEDLTDDGNITLPIVIKISTMDKQNITLNDSLTINYKTASSTVTSVDVTWGSLEFVYDDGSWDTKTHKWTNGGWYPVATDSNIITVKNNGNIEVKANLSYKSETDYAELTGVFVDNANAVVDTYIDIPVGGSEKNFWLNISGTTNTRWSDTFVTVGIVTLTLIS